ncbi:MAG: response regulator transcription factor [Leptonema sp. (in: bacteria)]
MTKKNFLLLVDDNDKYAKIIIELFADKYEIHRAKNGKEAIEFLEKNGVNFYSLIITDITMESQLAGLNFLKRARKKGYHGKIIIASTGFNYSIALNLAPLFLNSLKVDYLIPKDSLLKKELLLYPCRFFPKVESQSPIL